MLEKRKYMLVPYQLSGRQGGIQAGHASDEYSLKYAQDAENIDFLKNHKTWIVLNGGTTNDREDYKGTINKDVELLQQHNIKHTVFREPDLGDVITAVCLIADERVFNKEEYPDFYFPSFKEWFKKYDKISGKISGDPIIGLTPMPIALELFLKDTFNDVWLKENMPNFKPNEEIKNLSEEDINKIYNYHKDIAYQKFVDKVGNEIAVLKSILNNKSKF